MFNHLIIGGTFDRLHLGHKKIINKAFESGKRITIGIAEKSLFKNKLLASTIENYQTRKKNIINYLQEKNWQKKVKFIPIVNFYGTTLTNKTIEAIIVSKATKKNAEIINQERKKVGLLELKIIVVNDVLAEDGKLISSERIRAGEIDREGKIYDLRFKNYESNMKQELILPEEMREDLRKPLGKVFLRLRSGQVKLKGIPMIISIGDIVSIKLMEVGINPDIKIIDFKTRREPIRDQKLLIKNGLKIKVKNNPGTINIKSFQAIKKAVNNYFKGIKTQTIVVKGEEDLLALPAALLAPLNSLVFYGQWDKGAIMVEVTEEKKQIVKKIVQKFVKRRSNFEICYNFLYDR